MEMTLARVPSRVLLKDARRNHGAGCEVLSRVSSPNKASSSALQSPGGRRPAVRAQRRGRRKVGEDGGGRDGVPPADNGVSEGSGGAKGRRVGDAAASQGAGDRGGAAGSGLLRRPAVPARSRPLTAATVRRSRSGLEPRRQQKGGGSVALCRPGSLVIEPLKRNRCGETGGAQPGLSERRRAVRGPLKGGIVAGAWEKCI